MCIRDRDRAERSEELQVFSYRILSAAAPRQSLSAQMFFVCSFLTLWRTLLFHIISKIFTNISGTGGNPKGKGCLLYTSDERIAEAPQLYSERAYLIRREDGAVLFSKGAEERMYPASLTKVMTALVALEQMAPQESAAARLHYLLPGYTVPESIFEELYRQSASLAGFEPGERVSGRDLIAGVLLPSGGDASLTLAIRLMGSEEQFVARMNERAAELGMTGTHFTNVCGLHDEQHYSTCLLYTSRCV